MRIPRLDSSRLGSGLVAGMLAVVFFRIAYDNGSYDLASRNSLAIAIWWALIVLVGFDLLPREPVSRSTLMLGALLAAFALWTSASLLWSVSLERAFDEVNRVTLYLGAFALVSVVSTRTSLARWIAGLAAALSGIAAVAILSRLIPGLFPGRDLTAFLPAAATRLSFPLGYWNGLAILLALGVPLLLGVAVASRSPALRGLSLVPMPIIASVIYLASSRGGVATAMVGSAVFLVLTERRWAASGALATSALGGSVALAVLLRRNELVDGPLGTELVEHQGRSAALLIALACTGTGAAYWLGCRAALRTGIRPSRAMSRAAVVAALLAVAVVVVAANPAERFQSFKSPPGEVEAISRGDFVKQHLLSSAGSGRWQFWASAVDQWRDAPLVGASAGSYESWWAAHGSIALFVRDAHSLYLETLGELGIVGLVLMLSLVGIGTCVGVRRARGTSGDVRVYAAALTAVFASYVTATGFDWVWELTSISIVGFAALALVSGAATAPPPSTGAIDKDRPARRMDRRLGLRVVTILVALGLVFAEAIPLLAQREITRSQAAVRRGELREALAAAGNARDIQPWAATPYLQLALVSEQVGALWPARRWIDAAVARDRNDWRLWLVSARIETKLGRAGPAEWSLRRAAALNPRSPLFGGLFPG